MELTKKLMFAEYLLDRDEPEMFLSSAKQHMTEASKKALMVLTNLNALEVQSQQIVGNVLTKFKDPTPKKFYKFYKKLEKDELTLDNASNALNKVKEFINWVADQKPARK